VSAEKLAEEAAFREKLVTEDVADTARPRMRLVVQIGVAELRPSGGDLVRFAHVGIQKMLEERVRSARNRRLRNSGPGVDHQFSFKAFNALADIEMCVVEIAIPGVGFIA
jgi:hypothetical protein